jgi:hypothetical protein
MLTPAYSADGNARPLHQLEEGDVVEWKRNGSSGFLLGRVTALVEKGHGLERRQPIRIMPIRREDLGWSGRQRWIGANSIMRIYERDGKTRKPPHVERGEAA